MRHRREQPAVDLYFSEEGAVVLACDKRDREKLGETGEKLENQGVELHHLEKPI